jgi:pimeloyl-[acyl-carrier protein] methyl ester esterase
MPLFEAPGRAPLAYADVGGAKAAPREPVLLFVHGWAADSTFFRPQLEHFASTHRVIAPDLRGHGGSRGGPRPDIAGMADDLEALIEGIGLERVAAVGWSMGASVLWELLGRGGGHAIAGLVTIDMSPRILNDVTWRMGLANGFDALDSARAVMRMREDWQTYALRVAANALADATAKPDLLDVFTQAFARNNPELMACAWEALGAVDLRDALTRIDIPMLVTHGALSKLYASDASAFVCETAPRATRVTFRHSGHAPHLEEPGRFNRLLNDFVAILSGRDAHGDIRRLGDHAASQPV